MEKEKEEQKNELLNEQKPETAKEQTKEEKVSTVSGEENIKSEVKGEENIGAELNKRSQKEENESAKSETPAPKEIPVIISTEKVILQEENSHVYRIKPRTESDPLPVKTAPKQEEIRETKVVEKSEAPAEVPETAKPEALPKIESNSDSKETSVTAIENEPVNAPKPEVEKHAVMRGTAYVETPAAQEAPSPMGNEFPFQEELDKVEKALENKESVEPATPAATEEATPDEEPKVATNQRNDRRQDNRNRSGNNRDNLRNPQRNQPRQPLEKKEVVPDPTIVKLKVDKGLVKTPIEIETSVTAKETPEKKEVVHTHDRKQPVRRDNRDREPVVRQDNKDKEQPVQKQERVEREPVVRTERVDREPVARQDNKEKEQPVRQEPKEREPVVRQDNRDRDRTMNRRNPREPYRTGQQQQQQPPQKPRMRTTFTKISVVIPLYNEDESLIHLANELKAVFRDLPIPGEVIFVDDGSTDKSLRIIKDICRTDQRFKFISFQQNFGKSAALNVGFKAAKGDVVITMDADLQDDPHEIPNLLKKLEEGHDMVSGWKKKRHDPFIKKYTSRLFNFVTAKMSGIKIHDFNCGLKAYKKTVVENLNIYGEMHRYIPILAKWKGFTVTELPVKHSPRKFGVTKFGASRFFKGFVDLITVTFITRYIKRPMHLFGFFGALAFMFGFVINGYLSYEWLFENQSLSNRPLLQLGMLLMIVGVQFFTTGLLGEMMVHNFQTEKEYSIKDSNVRG